MSPFLLNSVISRPSGERGEKNWLLKRRGSSSFEMLKGENPRKGKRRKKETPRLS